MNVRIEQRYLWKTILQARSNPCQQVFLETFLSKTILKEISRKQQKRYYSTTLQQRCERMRLSCPRNSCQRVHYGRCINVVMTSVVCILGSFSVKIQPVCYSFYSLVLWNIWKKIVLITTSYFNHSNRNIETLQQFLERVLHRHLCVILHQIKTNKILLKRQRVFGYLYQNYI